MNERRAGKWRRANGSKKCIEFAGKFNARFKYAPDHNGIKGYAAVYLIKYVTEKIGKFDGKAFAAAMKGMTLKPDSAPGTPDGSELGSERRY